MSDHTFVGREEELRQLQQFLNQANAGYVQVVFVAGEAGAGKSALVNEFVRRVQASDEKLIATIGECNAQTGVGDPYLPFRQVLTVLTGVQDEKQTANTVSATNAARLREFVRVSGETLFDVGPDLIGIFVPGASLAVKLATRTAKNIKLMDKLTDKMGKPDKNEARHTITPELNQENIFEQYTNVLHSLAQDRTLILILDDLQWADSASLNLLFHLVRQLKESRVLLVGTFRDDDVAMGRAGERHPLEPILNELKRYNGEIVIDLSATRASEGRALVDALIDSEPNQLAVAFHQELFARTEGNPLFTVELLRNLQERGDLVKDSEGFWMQGAAMDWNTLPVRVEGVIEERIARLAENLREELRVASVIGLDFTAQVIARVQNIQERELVQHLTRELDKRYRLVQEQGESRIGKQFLSRYRFTHAMFQQYLYNELGSSERRIMHGDVANVLEELYAGYMDEIAVQLARHFEEAGNDEKAIEYLTRSGDAAFRAFAQNEAVAYYTRALELSRQGDVASEQLSYLYMQRGRALELNNQFERALQNYNEMLTVAHARHDRPMELAAMLVTATLHSIHSGIPDATKGEQLSKEALELAQELGDRAAEAKALWNLMLVNMYLKGNLPQAIPYGEKSLAIARDLNLGEQLAYSTTDLGVAYLLNGQWEEAENKIDEGDALWRELGNLPMLGFILNVSMHIFLLRGEYDMVLRVGEESYQIGGSVHNVWSQGPVLMFQSFVWLDYGEPAKALDLLQTSIDLLEEKNRTFFLTFAHAMHFWFYATIGASKLGLDLYNKLRTPPQDIPQNHFRLWLWALYALFEIASGQLETAEATLQHCHFERSAFGATWAFLAKSRLAFALGNYPEAIAIADEIIEYMRQFKLGQVLPDILIVKGKAHWILGDRERAYEAFVQAHSAAEALGSRRMMWQILTALAEVEEDAVQASVFRTQAQEIVQYIADHTPPELRESFLAQAVRADITDLPGEGSGN